MEKLIEFIDVTVKLKDRILYNKLNFTLYKGDRYIYLGPNGVGKSLLLELIALGYSKKLSSDYKGLSVTGKMLDKNGNDLLDPNTHRQFAYVKQNDDFYNNTTVLQEAETACHGIGIDLNETKLDHFLEKFAISDKKNLKIKKNVSFGEGKIIHLITRILKLKATDVFLLDEPLNHLSFRSSKAFNDIINEEILSNPDLAIIMVSHCRAASFTDKALVYDTTKKNFRVINYTAYDCFSDELGTSICNTLSTANDTNREHSCCCETA